jgi:fibronectin type 3 domain-containing protein
MASLSVKMPWTKFGFYLLAILMLSGKSPCSASTPPPPVPASFQALYTSLDNYLVSFNTTLNSQWNGVKYPVLFTANLYNANANAGPQMINSGSVAAILAQLQELKALGVQAVTVEVGFPMLYEPFFSSQTQYQQFVTFYQNLAVSIRALGLKLIVENECLLNDQVTDSWNVAPFYASLNWTQYQAARAQTAVTIAQTMQPDYMVVLEEPDTEATMSGQTEAGTVAGSTSLLSGILSGLETAGVSGVQFGAGVGTWLSNYQQFIQSFLTLPVNFIDMHVLPVNDDFLPNALTIASMAAAAGKPVTMTQTWLHKEADDELGVLSNDQILARDPFSFWAPLDTYFLQTMVNMSYYTKMTFMDAFESLHFWAYLPYGTATENLPPSQIIAQEAQQSGQNMLAASFTSTALSYYSSILPVPDTAPPSTPGSLTAGSTQPTQAYLEWNASTDNVGVAGYYVFRNGVTVATTAQAFYTDSGLTDAATYSYFVEAFDLAGNMSAPSLTVHVTTWNTIPPSAPANVVGTAASCQEINLTWSAATDKIPISSYRVFRGTSANSLIQVGTTYSTPTAYPNYSLAPSTKYYFGVEAVDTDGNVSPMSAIGSASTLALPTAPSKPVAAAISTTAIGLTWTAGSSGMPLVGFYVFRGTTSSNLMQVSTTAAASYTSYSLLPGTAYYYAVQGFDQGGNVSPMSAVASATTLALPSPPASVTASAVSKVETSVSWTAAHSGMPLATYRVSRGSSPSTLTQLIVLGPTTTSFVNYPVTAGTTYYYGIQSTDTLGNLSPMSAVVQVTTPK